MGSDAFLVGTSGLFVVIPDICKPYQQFPRPDMRYGQELTSRSTHSTLVIRDILPTIMLQSQ